MFGLLFLLISSVFSTAATKVTLNTGVTEAAADGCKADANTNTEYECDTLAHSIAKMKADSGTLAVLNLVATAMATTAFKDTIVSAISINTGTGATTVAAALTLSDKALTIEPTTATDKIAISTLTVTIDNVKAQFAEVKAGVFELTAVTFAPKDDGSGTITFTSAITQPLITVASGSEFTMSGNGNKFSNLKSSVDGGMVSATVAAGKTFKLTATVDGVNSTGKGSVAYIAVAGDPTAEKFTLAVTQDANGYACVSEDFGDIVYMKITGTIASVTGHANVKALGAAQVQAGQRGWNQYIMETSGVAPFFDTNVNYVKSDGIETTACGDGNTKEKACKTIAKAIAADNTRYSANVRSLSIVDAIPAEATTVTTTGLSISGSSTVSVTNVAAFTVTGAMLYLKGLTFSFTDPTTALESNTGSLLTVSGKSYVNLTSITLQTSITTLFSNSIISGSITAKGDGETVDTALDMYGISLSGFNLNDKPVFDVSGTYNFYKSGENLNKFENINRKDCVATNKIANGGAVFSLTSASLDLNNININNCASTAKDADASVLADAIFWTPSGTDVEFGNSQFTAASSSSAAAKYIFINAAAAANVPTYQSLASFFWGSSATGLIVRAKIGDETANVDMSTAGITIAMGTHATTDSATNCGAEYNDGTTKKTVPCATLAEVAGSSFWKGKNYKALTIASGLAVQAAGLSIDGYLAISGAGPMTFKLASGALFTLSANAHEVDVNGCTFTYNDGTADTTNAEPVEISTPVFKLSGANNVLILTGVTIGVDETKNNLVLTTEAISYSAGTVTIDGCTFQNLNRKDDCLVSPLPAADAFVMKNTNTFKTIAITGYGSGAAMATTLTAATDAVVITGATFEACTAVGNAGALAVIITAGSLTVSKCTFTNCGATKSSKADESFSGYGGAMGIIIISSGTPTFTFSELAFTGCTAGTAGSVLAVTCPEDYMKTAYPSFAEFIKLGRTANVAVYGTIAEDGTLTPNDLYKLVPETVSVDKTNGEDSATCGVADETAKTKACKSFAKSLATFYGLPTKIVLTKEAFEEDTAAQWQLAQTMSIKGTTAEGTATDRTSLKLKNCLTGATKNYIFYIGNEVNAITVSFADMTFNINTETENEDCIFFNVSAGATLELNNVGLVNVSTAKVAALWSPILTLSGKLSLTNVNFDKFYLSLFPVITVSSVKSFTTFTGCNFNEITRVKGDGAALALLIVDGDNFNLAENNFTSCKTLNGNGGAVYINYNKGNLTIGNQEFNQTKKNCTTLFKSCSAASATQPTPDDGNTDAPTAGAGGAIYLNLEAVDEEKYLLNITSILIEDCTAAKGGNAMYAHATTEEGTKLLENKNFWSVLTKINGNKKDEFTIMDNEGNEEKPKGSSSGFPIWAIIVIVVVVVVVIVIVVVIIVCCCCRSSS